MLHFIIQVNNSMCLCGIQTPVGTSGSGARERGIGLDGNTALSGLRYKDEVPSSVSDSQFNAYSPFQHVCQSSSCQQRPGASPTPLLQPSSHCQWLRLLLWSTSKRLHGEDSRGHRPGSRCMYLTISPVVPKTLLTLYNSTNAFGI